MGHDAAAEPLGAGGRCPGGDTRPRPSATRQVNPRFSILTAVCDPPAEVLAECLASVARQTWSDHEHIVVDDASTSSEVRAVIESAAAADPRIEVILRGERGGIVAASSDALRAARGQLIALVDHDDVLAPHALAAMHAAFDDHTDLAYSDHDLLRADGRRSDPSYKPDFSPERLRQHNYITHFVVARRSVVEEVGGFRAGYEGAQDHDLLLRVAERARRITHVAEVLYHWRQSATSVAMDPTAKRYAYDNGRRAVADHCARVGIRAEVEVGAHLGTYRVRRIVEPPPRVSVLIASNSASATVWGRHRPHLEALLASLQRGAHPPLEIVVAVTGLRLPADSPMVDTEPAGHAVTVVATDEGMSPFAAAADAATGEIAVLLDEAMYLRDPGSLTEMVGLLADPDVAAVGGAQFHADGCVRHGGFVTHGDPSEILFGWPGDHDGPGRVMAVTREVSGVDLVGSAWRMDDLRTFVGGIGRRPPAMVGLERCRDAIERGSRVLWTPFSRWYRFDGVMADHQWVEPRVLAAGSSTDRTDPYYNPNLLEGRGDWLERPGHGGAPPYYLDESGTQRWV
jgi:O-antigen biosynthesis protein